MMEGFIYKHKLFLPFEILEDRHTHRLTWVLAGMNSYVLHVSICESVCRSSFYSLQKKIDFFF